MTTLSNAVVVNHQIFFSAGDRGDGGAAALDNTVEYLMREGRFESRGGLECEPTEADLKLMGEDGRFASLSDIADYGARQGRFEGRNPEIPMAPGEFSGGAWDERGLVDVEEMKRAIIESGSNVMRSVVTVPREWAPQLDLVTKEQWQGLIRGCWSASMDEWGIIPREDQRWAAFFHTDNKVNLHVHILSWDASGCHFTGERRVPRERFLRSVEAVRKAAYQKLTTARNIEKNYVRQALVLQAKLAYGAPVKSGEVEAVLKLAPDGCATRFEPEGPLTGPARERLDSLRERLVESLPPEGIGRAGYKAAGPDARAAANLSVNVLRSESGVGALYDRYVELAERSADMLGKTGAARGEYVRAQARDVERRLCNVVIREAARANQPWTRSGELARARAEVVEMAASRQGTALSRAFAGRIAECREIPGKAVLAVGFRALEHPDVERAAARYAEEVVRWAGEASGKELIPEQASRLEARARADLAEQIGARAVEASRERAIAVIERRDGALLSEVVREAAYGRGGGYELAYMSERDRDEISGALTEAARDCARAGAPSRDAVSAITARIMSLPDVSAALSIEAEARARAAGEPGRTLSECRERARAARTADLEDRVEREVMRLAARPEGERSIAASGVLGALAAAAMRTAMSGRAVERGGSREGMVRSRAKTHKHQQELSR